jgi:hypothetical protein
MKGLWRRIRVPISDIRTVIEIEYDPTAQYHGYGISSGPLGQAYFASGNQAVQLEFRDGHKLLIGSQPANELARKIVEAQQLT